MKTRSLPIRLSLLGVILCWTSLACASGPTNISGIISGSTTWAAANSPYVVTGNVLVSAGVTLTVEPGTQVTFQPGTFLQIDGTLIADGNESAVIVFTSAQSTPAAGDWGPLTFTPSSIGAIVSGTDYVSGSVLRYARIEYGKGVGLTGAYPYLSNSTFYKNAGNNAGGLGCIPGSSALHWGGGSGTQTSGTLVIKNNVFEQNQTAGLATDVIGIGAKYFFVISNQFLNNLGTAVAICNAANGVEISSNFIFGNPSGILLGNAGSVTTIANNTIMGCSRAAYTAGIAIDISDGSPTIQNNLISDNRQGGSFCIGPCSIINIYDSGRPTVQNNTFWSNQAYSLIYFNLGGGGTYSGNNFQFNQVQYFFYRTAQSSASANAAGNYWSTTDTAVIDSVIYDFFDDFNPGIISYTPILSAPNSAAPLPIRRRGQSTSQ